MVFKGQPKLAIMDYTGKTAFKVGTFDENGLMDIPDDSKYIDRLKRKYEVYNAEEKQAESKETTEKKIVCKKCGQEFGNQGELMSHYRKEHPK